MPYVGGDDDDGKTCAEDGGESNDEMNKSLGKKWGFHVDKA